MKCQKVEVSEPSSPRRHPARLRSMHGKDARARLSLTGRCRQWTFPMSPGMPRTGHVEAAPRGDSGDRQAEHNTQMPGIATNGVNGVQMLLPEEDWDALMIGLSSNKSTSCNHLKSGSECRGNRARHGNRVMAGAALTEALIRDFNLPRPRDLSLRRVYAAAEGRMSLTGIDLSTYLQDLYTGCQAPAWAAHTLSPFHGNIFGHLILMTCWSMPIAKVTRQMPGMAWC